MLNLIDHYDKILVVGFELEFILKYSFFESKNKKIREFIIELEKILGKNNIFFTEDNISVHKEDYKYKLTYDMSIKYDDCVCLFLPLELITPKMSFKEGVEKLKEILTFLRSKNVLTNNTTGLHVNLSFKDNLINKKIDPLKLIFLSSDVYKIKKWPRRNINRRNSFHFTMVDPNIVIIERIFDSLNEEIMFFTNEEIYNYDSLKSKFMNVLNSFKVNNKIVWLEKKQSINLRKLFDHNYVEFRIVGGDNYHLKTEEIIEEIFYFSDLMKKSIDEKYNNKCIIKILRIINKFLFKNKKFDNERVNKLIEKYDFIFSKKDREKYFTYKLIDVCLNKRDLEKANYLFKKLLYDDNLMLEYGLKNTAKNFYFKLIKELNLHGDFF